MSLHLVLALPISDYIIALFIAYMYNRGVAVSTVRTHMSAITFSHKILGLPSPSESFLVCKLLKGFSNIRRTSDERFPIMLPVLQKILHVIPCISESLYQNKLFSAMCSTAFYAFLRCSEMCVSPHNLRFDQITITPNQSFLITFRNFKHNTSGKPFTVKIVAKPNFCPVSIVSEYIAYRGSKPGFLFCLANDAPVPRHLFNKWFTSVCKLLQLPCNHYKIHSFRIGAATSALLAGKSEKEIQLLGRWSSTAFNKYLRLAGIVSLWYPLQIH